MNEKEKPGNLSISRRLGETLLLGDDERISIERIQPDRVSLRITAPRSVRIQRGERVDDDRS